MNWYSILRATLAVAFVVHAAAAQTFIVDANNGPGTSFTSLAVATATVPDGAVLVVRAGQYDGPVTISGKSVAVLCDPGAALSAPVLPVTLKIDGIAANQSVMVRGLRLKPDQMGAAVTLVCTNSPGLICIDDVSPATGTLGAVHLDVTACAALRMRNCTFMGRTTLTASEVAMVACTVPTPTSVAPAALARQENGIDLVGGALQLVDCSVHGLNSTSGPAVSMNAGSLRGLGNTTLIGGSGLFGSGRAIAGSGSARLDPAATLVGGIGPGVVATTAPMPHVTVAEVLPVGTVQANLHGPVGHAGFVMASLTVPAFVVPGLFADSIWLDPLSMVMLASGVPGTGAPVVATLSLPAVSTTLGFEFVWQGLTFDPVAGLQISNPEHSVVH